MASDSLQDELSLVLDLSEPDSDVSDLERTTEMLRQDLRDLPVSAGNLDIREQQHTGAKSASELPSVGAVAISLLPTVLPLLFKFLADFLKRHDKRKAVIKVEYKGRTAELEINGPLSASDTEQLIRNLGAQVRIEAER